MADAGMMLESARERGMLFPPDRAEPGFVDLVRALMQTAGCSGPDDGRLSDVVRPDRDSDTLVFVLVDGLGYDLTTEALPEGSFMRRNLGLRIQAVFPSTTAAAMTTLCTGMWPSRHGMQGWWSYLPSRDLSITSLPFRERTSGRDLRELDVPLQEVFPQPSAWASAKRRVLFLKPRSLVGSVFSGYSDAGNPSIGYSSLEDAFSTLLEQLSSGGSWRLISLYLPQLDTISHTAGPRHPDSIRLLTDIDRLLQGLRERAGSNVRIVVSADHGHLEVPSGSRFLITAQDPLLAHLHCWPAGEPVVPVFHVREGHEQEFFERFEERTRGLFALLSPDQVEELGLLGPGRICPTMRERLGTAMGVATEPAALLVRHEGDSVWQHVGYHAGMSHAEMFVPLVVA